MVRALPMAITGLCTLQGLAPKVQYMGGRLQFRFEIYKEFYLFLIKCLHDILLESLSVSYRWLGCFLESYDLSITNASDILKYHI